MNIIDAAIATVTRALEHMTDAECGRSYERLTGESADANVREFLRTALIMDIKEYPLAAADGARWVLAFGLSQCPTATGPETQAESLARFDAWTARREAAGLGTVDEERDGILSRDRVSCAACSAIGPAASATKVGDDLICERCVCACCGEFVCRGEHRDAGDESAFRPDAERLLGGAL